MNFFFSFSGFRDTVECKLQVVIATLLLDTEEPNEYSIYHHDTNFLQKIKQESAQN